MAPTHIDFDAKRAESAHECPFSFTLGGRDWHCRDKDDVPLSVVLSATAGEGQTLGKVQVASFFEAVLVEDEQEPFITMLDDRRSPLTIGVMQELMDAVSEAIFGRPTTPPES